MEKRITDGLSLVIANYLNLYTGSCSNPFLPETPTAIPSFSPALRAEYPSTSQAPVVPLPFKNIDASSSRLPREIADSDEDASNCSSNYRRHTSGVPTEGHVPIYGTRSRRSWTWNVLNKMNCLPLGIGLRVSMFECCLNVAPAQICVARSDFRVNYKGIVLDSYGP